MKIIHKLTLGYLIVSLFFMIVAIVGVLTINNINVAFDELSKENIPVVEALENVKTLGLKMGLASSEFAHEQDEMAAIEQNVEDEIAISVRIIIGVALFAFFIAIVLGLYISKSISDPITRLKNAAEDISKGKMDTRVDIKSGDELGILAAGFNQMASDLKQHTDHLDALVTERTLALSESEEKFESIAATANDAIIMIDNNGKIEYWNDAARKIFGYSKQEMINKDLHLILAPGKYHNAYREGFAKLRMTGEGAAIGKTLEFDAKKKDGTIFPIELSVSALKLKGKWHSIGILRDITERKKAEEKIIKLNEELVRKSHEIQSVINSLLSLVIEDKTLEDILKGALERIFSIPWLNLESKGSIFLVEDEPDVLVMKAQTGLSDINQEKCSRIPFGRCFCGRAAQSHEVQFADSVDDRHDIVYEGMQPHGHYCIPIISAGRTLGVIGLYLKEGHRREQHEETFLAVVADTLAGIIQRKKSESSLKESEERHRNLVNFSPFGIAIHSEGKIIYMNAAGANILGSTSPDKFIGKKILDIVRPDYHVIARERIHMQEMGKVALPLEEVFVRVDGTFVDVEITAIPFAYNGKKAMYGVFKDITERKRNEEMLIKNIRLEEADKVKSDFIASMSHELRTPLNSSIGFSELLKMGSVGELNEKQERYVDNILASNQFLLTLINDILDLSKIEAGKIELVIEKMSVPVTIKETLSLIKEKASKNNVLLKTEFDPELEFIIADKQRFKQVLFNLLSNAVKFTPKDGTVTIRTKKEGNMAHISVSDTGIGIREENIGKLFQKFEQLEPGISKQFGGTGLGLAITKQLVELHGGAITAESKFGEGSTFTFTLPIEAKKRD
ncbi:MAG: PAS domain S-box protein [Candidatus Methanoperedens sp.]|nr:PAS domain S-box protein [Candidatus Methanoperedens sp.]